MDLKTLLKYLKLNESTVSMIFGAALVLVVAFLAVNYFRGRSQQQAQITPTSGQTTTPAPTTSPEEGKVPANLPKTHKVEKGEHLWGIAERYFKSGYNWVDIAKANNLKNPNAIEIGQELSIPEAPAKIATVDGKLAATFGSPITSEAYTVEKGDHLWGISVRAYGDGYQWVRVARANTVPNPNIILIGQVLKLPRDGTVGSVQIK